MDLHVDLNDEEVEYLQSIGLTDNIEEALTEVEKISAVLGVGVA